MSIRKSGKMMNEKFKRLVGVLICCRWPDGALASMDQNAGRLIVSPEHAEWAERTAREFLQELRDPTDEMIDHFGDALGDKPENHESARELWREVFDDMLGS